MCVRACVFDGGGGEEEGGMHLLLLGGMHLLLLGQAQTRVFMHQSQNKPLTVPQSSAPDVTYFKVSY